MDELIDSLYKGFVGGKILGKTISQGLLQYTAEEKRFLDLYAEEVKNSMPLVERVAAIAGIASNVPAIVKFWAPILYNKLTSKYF